MHWKLQISSWQIQMKASLICGQLWPLDSYCSTCRLYVEWILEFKKKSNRNSHDIRYTKAQRKFYCSIKKIYIKSIDITILIFHRCLTICTNIFISLSFVLTLSIFCMDFVLFKYTFLYQQTLEEYISKKLTVVLLIPFQRSFFYDNRSNARMLCAS